MRRTFSLLSELTRSGRMPLRTTLSAIFSLQFARRPSVMLAPCAMLGTCAGNFCVLKFVSFWFKELNILLPIKTETQRTHKKQITKKGETASMHLRCRLGVVSTSSWPRRFASDQRIEDLSLQDQQPFEQRWPELFGISGTCWARLGLLAWLLAKTSFSFVSQIL